MKIQLTLFFSLSFFILAAPPHSAAALDPIRLPTAGQPVMDVDGKVLLAGSEYYLSTDFAGRARGQGVKLAKLDFTAPCPNDIVVLSFNLGDPVVFTPALKDNFVIESTFQTISFTAAAAAEECPDKLSWKVEQDDEFGRQLVKAGEAVENVSNLFRIEPVDIGPQIYKLTYCPRDEDNCYDVGRYLDWATGTTHLALTNSTESLDNSLIVFKEK